MCFIVENEGPLPARNVVIKINQEFLDNIKEKKDKEWIEAMNTTDLFLASKQQLYFCLGGMPQFDNISKVKAVFDIAYNEEFKEHIEIDIRQYRSSLIYNSALEDISKHLKHLQEDNKKHHSKMEKFMDRPLRLSSIVVYNADEDDKNKRKIYKTICGQAKLNSSQIATIVDMEENYVLEKIIELEKIDKLVTWTTNDNNDLEYDKLLWYRK